MVARAVASLLAASAAAAATGCSGAGCPPGATPRGGQPPRHAARWCERGPSNPAEPPVAFPSARPLRVPLPSSLGTARLDGPYTSYYPSGKPESHGAYAPVRGRSVAHGMWTFWHSDGSRQSRGRFQFGDPIGCFASWSDDGSLTTGVAEGGEIRPADCDPPGHQEADVLEADHGGPARPRLDIELQVLQGITGGLGARSTRYVPDEPDMAQTLALLVRRRFGAVRLGGAAALRLSDTEGYVGSSATALAGGSTGSGATALDGWVELGGLLLWARPKFEDGRVSEERVFLWTPLAATQVEGSWRLSTRLELTLAGRFELRFPRSVTRATLFCAVECVEERDTWSLGGVAVSLGLGARVILW